MLGNEKSLDLLSSSSKIIQDKLQKIDISSLTLKNKKLNLESVVNDILQIGNQAKSLLNEKRKELINQNLNHKIQQIQNICDELQNNYNTDKDTNSINSICSIKDDISSSLRIIINCLEISPINEYYLSHFWLFINSPPIIYTSDIEPSYDKNIPPVIQHSYLLNDENFMKKYFNKFKNIELLLIKKRKNSTIGKIVSYIKDNLFDEYLMRKDENNNILLKGILKVDFIFFENYFLTTFEDYKNFDYITINIYLNKISLFKDFSEEYDKTNISKDNILKIMVANNEIEKIRTFLLKK